MRWITREQILSSRQFDTADEFDSIQELMRENASILVREILQGAWEDTIHSFADRAELLIKERLKRRKGKKRGWAPSIKDRAALQAQLRRIGEEFSVNDENAAPVTSKKSRKAGSARSRSLK